MYDSKTWQSYLEELAHPEFVDTSSLVQHKELDPQLWENSKLKLEIADRLYMIAKEFFQSLKLDPSVMIKDVILTGSLASYNWSDLSDLDIHILLDFSQLSNIELYQDYFKQKTMNWNRIHGIYIKGYEVELYIQDTNEPHQALGIYSLVKNRFIKRPSKYSGDIDYAKVKQKASGLMDQIDNVYDLYAEKEYKQARKLADYLAEKIKKYRRAGLKTEGVYSIENLVFKVLRRNDYIKNLYTLKTKSYDSDMSINGTITESLSNSKNVLLSEATIIDKTDVGLVHGKRRPVVDQKGCQQWPEWLGAPKPPYADLREPLNCADWHNKYKRNRRLKYGPPLFIVIHASDTHSAEKTVAIWKKHKDAQREKKEKVARKREMARRARILARDPSARFDDLPPLKKYGASRKASTHYEIDINGDILNYLDPAQFIANHTKDVFSTRYGSESVNNRSIGIDVTGKYGEGEKGTIRKPKKECRQGDRGCKYSKKKKKWLKSQGRYPLPGEKGWVEKGEKKTPRAMKPEAAQVKALGSLIKYLAAQFNIPLKIYTGRKIHIKELIENGYGIVVHGSLKATGCPGAVRQYLPKLGIETSSEIKKFKPPKKMVKKRKKRKKTAAADIEQGEQLAMTAQEADPEADEQLAMGSVEAPPPGTVEEPELSWEEEEEEDIAVVEEQTEPYQKAVKKNHRKMKMRLIGKGKNTYNVGGKMKKPSYKRSKSAPAAAGGS